MNNLFFKAKNFFFPTVVPHFYHHLVFLCECLLTSSLFFLYFVKKKYLGKSVKQKLNAVGILIHFGKT